MQIDLGPHEYHDRKPKGWRWRLPLGDPDDNRLPLVMFGAAISVLGFVFLNRDAISTDILFGVTALFAFGAGGMLQLFTRDY